jgi:glucose/arabinose dehydrogenase
VWDITLDGDKVVNRRPMLQARWGRIRDVRQGPDGWLYVLTDGAQGKLLRVGPLHTGW